MDIGFIEERKIVVSTTIPKSIYEDIKRKHYNFNKLLILGYRHLEEYGENKIKEQDAKIEKLTKRLAYYIGLLEEREKWYLD